MMPLALFGGLRGALFATAALSAMVALGIQTVRLSAAQADLARVHVEQAQEHERMAIALATSEQKARAKEKEQAEALAAISTQLQEDQAHALADRDHLITDLRAGTIQLRREWAGCETDRLSGATAAATEYNGDADLRIAGASDLIRIARDADQRLSACQQVIIKYRGGIR